MRTTTIALSLALFGVAHAPRAAADPIETPEYSRRGELSPGTQAPTVTQMLSVIRNGSPVKLRSTLEYGERVVCEPCVPLLERNLLESNDAYVREISAWWLRRQPFSAPALVVKLRRLVKSDADAVRRARAAEALGEFMDVHALPELIDAALEDQDPKVRAAAVRGLARLNSEAGFSALTDALGDRDTGVRLAALGVLAHIGSFRDYDALVVLLGDDSADVRTRAARLCGEFRVPEAEGALIAMLTGDSSPAARKAAAWALGRIGGADGQAAIHEAQSSERDPGVLDALRIAARMPGRF